MSRYLLDTGIVIRHLRGHKPTVTLMRNLGRRERMGIATITRLEVIAGMFPGEKYATQKLLSRFVNYNLDSKIADRAGAYVASARRNGRYLQVPDAIIAATAIQHNFILITLNKSDFADIHGVNLYPLG